MPTCEVCHIEFPNRVEIEGVMRNLSNRRFCLGCSPFKTYNRRDLTKCGSGTSFCSHCQQTLSDDRFYKRKSGRCRSCHDKYVTAKRQKLKLDCIAYKGGCCRSCGYSRCPDALDFHHRDPSVKEFNINKSMGKRLTDRVRLELDKCDLLCANCHREVHAGYADVAHSVEHRFAKPEVVGA